MTSTAPRSGPTENIRRILDLARSGDLLQHFLRESTAVEHAMRSTIESVVALRLQRQDRLERLTDPTEINAAVRLQVDFLESVRTGRRRATLPDATETDYPARVKGWAEVLVELEQLYPAPSIEFELALGAAFRAVASALQASINGGVDGTTVKAKAANQILNVAEAAARANVSRPTIYDWLAKKRLIGRERGSKQGWLIPAKQIVGPGRIADGIPEVLEVLGDLAYDFSSEPRSFADGPALPIDKLVEGGNAVEEVLVAARRYLVNLACGSFYRSQPTIKA